MRSDYQPTLSPEGPRARQLAEAVRSDILRGRLPPGTRLPGSRALAARLALSRNTVQRAMADLVAEGWLAARAGSGLVVEELDPRGHGVPGQALAVSGEAPPAAPGFAWQRPPGLDRRQPPSPGCRFAMEGGTPDTRLLPLPELARAYRRVLQRRGRTLMDYGPPEGEPVLRQALARWLTEARGLPLDPARILPVRGSQMGLDLVARTLLRPGDVVAVEAFGYAPAWGALEGAGARLQGVRVDEEGLCVDEIPAGVRAVYLTPHHQYPTTVLLSAGRRTRLLERAAREGIVVIEDDYDHEFHFEGEPVLPLVARDRAGVVVSIGTLSKAFAPGIRLGWVVAPPPLIQALAALRRRVDRQGDRVVEAAVAALLEDGTVARHIRRTRRIYHQRRDALLEGISMARLPLRVQPSAGGLALWCHTGVDADRWAQRAQEHGVHVRPGRHFRLDGAPAPALRLGFAGLDTDELMEALQLLGRACPPR